MLTPFLLGLICAFSLTAGVFFLRFWRDTRDLFFCAFAVFFFVDAGTRVALIFSARPNEGSPWIYMLRLFTFLVILAAILHKNYGSGH